MGDFKQFYDARRQIGEILQKDFIGPVTEAEILNESPVPYYIMGKLYPQQVVNNDVDTTESSLLENTSDVYDASISLSNQLNPSSLGITCTIKSGTCHIGISGGYAFYDCIPFEQAADKGVDITRWIDDEKQPKEFWRRVGYTIDEDVILDQQRIITVTLARNIELQVYTHAVLANGDRVITVVLINRNPSDGDWDTTSVNTAFQVHVQLNGLGDESIFTYTNHESYLTEDPELQELELLYSDVHCYGQGHGCSVYWDEEHDEPLWVASSYFPTFNLHQMKAARIDCGEIFSMKYLASAAPDDVIAGLRRLLSLYEKWIAQKEDEAQQLNGMLSTSARRNIEKCRAAWTRINHAIDLLDTSARAHTNAYIAFRYANEAMLLQRIQGKNREGKTIDEDSITWYPFQLAFILQELSSFIEPGGEDRRLVDLLWFPTGGGKTEAYLGIAAFVIFLRRLDNPADDGVTAIMRYTLRLLTLQQFERASMLICACELLRNKYHLGGSEISIGLWVGGKLTPNHLSDARKNLRLRQNGDTISGDEADPCQILRCPWCGHDLYPTDYEVDLQRKRMHIRCPEQTCYFHKRPDGLPIHIIDEAIYQWLPTFVVATVDKFAQIALRAEPANLFGIDRGKKKPELIIQDELHLISGPLGTVTGIYEAAITKLCEQNGIPAKVIASTATIRNADNQIRALYGRRHSQFPPQGISAKDSFFAQESDVSDRPARRYYGVLGVGTTATTTLIRVYAALLFATRYLAATKQYSDEVIDNFWTITGYFNSIRELGGATTQIMDDVQSRFHYLAGKKFADIYPGVAPDVKYDNEQELTSRMDNHEIAQVIQDRLMKKYSNSNHTDVYDFVLATNMISVGVDVARLGTMVVTGQPKTNAEYIQATSRVGRSNPGLVITVYNASRSRDRSHYEQFDKYHSALYRYVEATSLTPFSDRARDRGLHALFVAMCRNLVDDLRKNEDAAKFDQDDSRVKAIVNTILDYVAIVDPTELSAVRDELQSIQDKWEREAVGVLVYTSFKDEKKLLTADTDTSLDGFPTMNSMRNVDTECGVWLYRR